jgi:hypothetical protein
MRRASYSKGNAFSPKNGPFFDHQFGVLYSCQQEADSQLVKFYGHHPLISTSRSKPQRSPRTS